MDKIKIGFVGTGGMGQMAHLKNYAILKDCEIVAIAEMRENMGKGVAAKYGIPKVYTDHNTMLANEKLDGVVASQQFSVHASLLPELLSKVKHVFSEKPIAVSVEAGKTIAAAAAKHGSTLMVGYHKRSDPATVTARKTIDAWKQSGRKGALKYIRVTMPSGDWLNGGGFDGLVSGGADKYPAVAKEAAPEGFDKAKGDAYIAFVNYYIHQINLLRHLLGESYKITYAEKSGVMLAAQSASGVSAIIEMTPYRTTIDWQEEALVAFEKGYVHLKLPAPMALNQAGTVEIFEDEGNGAVPVLTSPVMPRVHAMKAQAQNFVNVCRGAQPPCGADEAVMDLEMARDYINLKWSL